MSRTLSANATAAINAQETAEVFVCLLDLFYGSNHYYFCDNNDVVTSGGTDYQPFPFEFKPADDVDQTIPAATLTIDNVDQSVITLLQQAQQAGIKPQVKAALVLASSPDTLELPWQTLNITNIDADSTTITATCSMDIVSDEPFPGDYFTPDTHPDLFLVPPKS